MNAPPKKKDTMSAYFVILYILSLKPGNVSTKTETMVAYNR